MKLVLLDQFSDLGGAQQALLDLLTGVREAGWDALVGLPGSGELFTRVREGGFRAERIECGPYASGRKSAGDLARFLREMPRLARQLRAVAADADLVYINGPRLLPAASLASLCAPVVFHSHSFLGPGIMRRVAGTALRRLNASVIANCEFVAAVWRRYVERVEVIFNGVAAPPDRLSQPRPSGSIHIATIGRIAPEKGQLDFLSAAREIHKAIPHARFSIFGAPLFAEPGAEAYDREVRLRAAQLPVEFAGWIGDVYAALAQIDILLVCSAPHEATTRVILEAYAAGVPLIAFASGGIPEIVDDGVTGILTHSPSAMAAATIALLKDPSRRAAMSVVGRDYWARRFTLERYRRDVLSALEIVQRRGSPDPPLRPTPGRNQAG
jgi:glycosyltransferase involved in cell wall biosynthesis